MQKKLILLAVLLVVALLTVACGANTNLIGPPMLPPGMPGM